MTETRTPTQSHSTASWHYEHSGGVYWFCSQTGVKLGRIAGPGVLMVKDKRSKQEIPLTVNDLLNVTEEAVTVMDGRDDE
jgi:hypothetical protein